MRFWKWILVLMMMGGMVRVGCAETLGEGWGYRRVLMFKPAVNAAGLTGNPEAWADFYTNGTQRGDAGDVRVTTADRTIVPSRVVLSSQADDFIRIVFETKLAGPYYVWWGNAGAGKTGNELDVTRGVFVEVSKEWGGAPQQARTAEGLEQMRQRGRVVGAFFVPEIFLGYDPLGNEPGVMFHYASSFRVEKAGAVEFAFAVLDSGTLWIDGEPMLHEFRSGWKNKVRESRSVDLTAGWHRIEVTQVNFNGGPGVGVSVVWKRDGEANFTPMPAEVFAPIARADAGALEKVGGGAVADFGIAPEAETFVPPEGYIERYSFDAVVPSGMSPGITWDFGDGEVMTGVRRQSHDYLAAGVYPVTLKLREGNNTLSTTIRVTVKDRLYGLFPMPPEDKPRVTRVMLSDYDEKKLSGAAALRGMQFYKMVGDDEKTIAWAKAWLQSKDFTPETTLQDEVGDLVELLEERKDFGTVADVYKWAAEKIGVGGGMSGRLRFAFKYVQARCDFFDDATPGLEAALDWRKRINGDDANQVRMAAAPVVYAAIAQGDAKIAKDALAAMGQDRSAAYNHAQIRQGVLARNIEAYIRTKDFAAAEKLLDDWEMEFPEAIWDGFTRTLRVKLYAAQGWPGVAARIAVEHARANPAGFYAAELLFRAGENFKAAGEQTQAKAAMDLLVGKYPESPYARGGREEER